MKELSEGTWKLILVRSCQSYQKHPLVFYSSRRIAQQFQIRGIPKPFYSTFTLIRGCNSDVDKVKAENVFLF